MYRMHNRLTVSCLLAAILIGCLGWKAQSTTHHNQLNRALIAAIDKEDCLKAISLLAQGADPKARISPSSAHATHSPLKKDAGITALLDLYRIRGYREPPLNINLVSNHPMPENIPLLKALLAKGADVNARDQDGQTALMGAAFGDYVESVRLLLQHGADVHIGGDNALLWARGDGSVVRLLLDHGANPNAKNDYGGTILMHWAGGGERVDTVRLLLERGAKVNARDSSGWTALMKAAYWGNSETVKLLLQRGANVNARKRRGRRPYPWLAFIQI